MDEQRARIQEDLRGLIAGDVRCDDTFVQLYASDASIFQARPLGVVRPRTKDDVVVCVQYAAEHRLPLHARGAGSGLAGQAIGSGLVVDFSRYLRRIVRIDAETVRVQPGVVLEALNTELRSRRRMFGPDPATLAMTTVGGMIGVDSGGSHGLRYGSVRQHVKSLEIVTADGQRFEMAGEAVDFDHAGQRETNHAAQTHEATQTKRQLVRRVAALLARHAETIAAAQPRTLVNTAGYHLAGVLDDGRIDLAQLLTGSEGTLALITEATLATVPVVDRRGVVMLFFESLEQATHAVQKILPFRPSACDLMDRRHLSLARDADARYERLIPRAAEAMLLVEYAGDDPAEVRDTLRGIVDGVTRRRKLAFDARQAFEAEEVELLWELARHVIPTLYRLKGSARAVPCIEDIAVAPEVLPEFLIQLQNILKRHYVTASLFAHAGQGQLHVRPFLDLAVPADVEKINRLAQDVYHAVREVRGTISGEHGDGYSRTAFLEEQYGPLFPVFREVKRIFDPHNILNPGKIIGDGVGLPTEHIRPAAPGSPGRAGSAERGLEDKAAVSRPLIDLQLNWGRDGLVQAARNCNGCGACRSQAAETRMCPIFHVRPAEEASPRAKANLMRAVVTGELDADAMLGDDFKAVADLCVNCHMCRIECPASVDIPRLMLEAKGAYVATNGLRSTEWLAAHIDRLSRLASLVSPLSNWLIAHRAARWLAEKTLGVAQGRKLPRAAAHPFLRRARRQRLTRRVRRAEPKIAYFVDTYANYHDPELAEALVAVMQHNGVAVYVPSAQQSSGMPLVAAGAIAAARRLAAYNVSLLADAVRQGYHIVASEPSAAMCLTHEYPLLLGDEDDDARLVAEHSSEACGYLWSLHRRGRLKLNFQPLSAALFYHTPCHVKALGSDEPGENLLRLIPALRVHKTESGCSGMAGTFGLMRKNYRTSLRAGRALISCLREPGIQAGTTTCSACKIQMEQGTQKPTVHPLKLLALAYGLMPELARRLSAHSEELVVT